MRLPAWNTLLTSPLATQVWSGASLTAAAPPATAASNSAGFASGATGSAEAGVEGAPTPSSPPRPEASNQFGSGGGLAVAVAVAAAAAAAAAVGAADALVSGRVGEVLVVPPEPATG